MPKVQVTSGQWATARSITNHGDDRAQGRYPDPGLPEGLNGRSQASAHVLADIQPGRRCQPGQLRLPEIQRDYVWKPAQIAGLLDSLYKDYPSGSILLWETDQAITERRAKIDPTGAPPVGAKVQFLLEGQQRLTSLHRVLHDPANTRVVFNIEDERFQIESAATAQDSRWVPVHEVLVHPDLFAFVDDLALRTQASPEARSAGESRRCDGSPATSITSR